jgi:hypothetical protein
MPITMENMQEITGYVRVSLNRVIERNELASHLEPGKKGIARVFSRDNAFELGVICALLRCGVDGPQASVAAKHFLAKMKDGALPRYFSFSPQDGVLFAEEVGGIAHGKPMQSDHLLTMLSDQNEAGWTGDEQLSNKHVDAISITTIHLAGILARVDSANGGAQ